jgi:hypothetical protein
MAYFWVNHKQTVVQERSGGYLWSPFRNSNDARNATYDSMSTVMPGDVVFSYANTVIGAIGTVLTHAKKAPKPSEFGQTGNYWSDEGWLVNVEFEVLPSPLRPKDYIAALAPLLPKKHSPIRQNGKGNQGCYLAPISDALGRYILDLLGRSPATPQDDEESDVKAILNAADLTETEKQQLVQSRRGQGKFRAAVLATEPRCRVTGVDVPELLRASHMKPWRDSDNRERLDGNNGLMLAPHVDLLFDKGLISFSDSGELLVSSKLPLTVLRRWAIDPSMTVGTFAPEQITYLRDHRTRYGF